MWAFDPGVAPGLLRIYQRGKTESAFSSTGAFTWISQHGSYEDVCAALAPDIRVIRARADFAGSRKVIYCPRWPSSGKG